MAGNWNTFKRLFLPNDQWRSSDYIDEGDYKNVSTTLPISLSVNWKEFPIGGKTISNLNWMIVSHLYSNDVCTSYILQMHIAHKITCQMYKKTKFLTNVILIKRKIFPHEQCNQRHHHLNPLTPTYRLSTPSPVQCVSRIYSFQATPSISSYHLAGWPGGHLVPIGYNSVIALVSRLSSRLAPGTAHLLNTFYLLFY